MKTLILFAALLALPGSLLAHGRFIIGPKGGRLLAIDSPTTPNAEFKVTSDRRFEITFLDKDRKPLPLGGRKLTVTAGERGSAQKLAVEAKGEALLTVPAPEGGDYWVIMQVREEGAAKSLPFRVHYHTVACADCGKQEWLCECGSKDSGKNIVVPDSLDGLWAEINQHTKELHEGTADKAYEAIDEVTEAFPVLAKALPGKTDAAKKDEAAKLVETLLTALNGIRDTFAARKADDAKPHLASADEALTKLKALYPAKIANAQLKE